MIYIQTLTSPHIFQQVTNFTVASMLEDKESGGSRNVGIEIWLMSHLCYVWNGKYIILIKDERLEKSQIVTILSIPLQS